MSIENLTDEEQDELAWAVIDRYRRAKEQRQNTIVHQDCSALTLMDRARSQFAREYMPDDAASMEEAFGFCPTRYYGVAQQKVNATYNWKFDLVINSLSQMFTVDPSPNPDIDVATRQRIHENVRLQLIEKIMQTGVLDPSILVDENGKVDAKLEQYIQEQAQALKQVEQAQIVSTAKQASKRAQTKMRDLLTEGEFEPAYAGFSFDQILYGRGIMKYPHYKTKLVRYHTKGGGIGKRWEQVPTFKHISVFDFYPMDDAENTQENTGNTERTSITKASLIKLVNSKAKGYFHDVIIEVLDEYEYRGRNWLGPLDDDDNDERNTAQWWGQDEPIDMLIHEGLFSGKELKEYGIKGVDDHDFVDARVEVVGGRTIRAEMLDPKKGKGRTYFQAPFVKCGDGLYQAIGIGALVWDTEQRVNRLMHIFEHNVDWAARPAVLRNRSAFDNPNDANMVVPGGQYDVEEQFGASGNIPDAVRPVQSVSGQYHLIMTQVGALLQQADNDAGIPAFAYGMSQNMGDSSLGEFTQRVSGALRTVKGLAVHEDFFFIRPCFTQMFDDLLDSDKDLRVGADINVQVRGMTGLLSADAKQTEQAKLAPMVIQGAQQGIMPPIAGQYAVRQLLESAGYPVDELGMADPVTDQALAAAAQMPNPQAGSPMSQQVPTLDGRSGPVPQSNVAAPDGANQANLAQVSPIV